jgi:hypothetical protein
LQSTTPRQCRSTRSAVQKRRRRCAAVSAAAGDQNLVEPHHCTQSLLAFDASQLFASVPKSVSCVSAVSLNMFGVHALSVTHAIQLAPSPLMVV